MKIGLLQNDLFLKHAIAEPHPENPERIRGLKLEMVGNPLSLTRFNLRAATEEEIRTIHSDVMLEAIKNIRGEKGWLDPDTYYGPDSTHVALCAAGGSIDMARAVMSDEITRGLSLVRPPGHHATQGLSQGFCLFNNVALAAKAILDHKPQTRIAIVDFDLHHGNGTQDIFYDDERVLFVSSHRFPFYPGTGALEEVGTGKGRGTTFNFPVASPHGHHFFLGLYRDIVAPLVSQFQPDIILVSAGFDGHIADPMQGFCMTTETFRDLARILIQLANRHCQGRILFCLEGGYDPKALQDSIQAVWIELNAVSESSVSVAEGHFNEWERFRAYFKQFVTTL